ncbi:MAG: phosphatidylserine decarboxylase family protein [Muribaculaceae bacterium]|nr:phosphatidylserine decarboxylase family protein [Muribaculaceae bacterium]
MRVKLHHEGVNILIVTLIALLAVNVPLWLWGNSPVVAMVCTAVSAVFYLVVVNFFRSPKRVFPGDPHNAVVASADGKVVALEETVENEYLHAPAIQISVFMTIFNVHANWFPVDGEVVYTTHHKGRFQAAWLPKSSTENERSTVVIRTPGGQLVVVRQIAGAIARRIVTYAQPGIEASIEDHMGFIKFGSRVDIFVPVDSDIMVKLGDHTTGGVTQVARLNPSTANA